MNLRPLGPDTGYLDWRYLNGKTAPPATGLSNATLNRCDLSVLLNEPSYKTGGAFDPITS